MQYQLKWSLVTLKNYLGPILGHLRRCWNAILEWNNLFCYLQRKHFVWTLTVFTCIHKLYASSSFYDSFIISHYSDQTISESSFEWSFSFSEFSFSFALFLFVPRSPFEDFCSSFEKQRFFLQLRQHFVSAMQNT